MPALNPLDVLYTSSAHFRFFLLFWFLNLPKSIVGFVLSVYLCTLSASQSECAFFTQNINRQKDRQIDESREREREGGGREGGRERERKRERERGREKKK